jgi:hypothetical protein
VVDLVRITKTPADHGRFQAAGQAIRASYQWESIGLENCFPAGDGEFFN